MTYDTDPTRWSDAPDAAPDLLRDAFEAARHEAPNDLQMRSLALKLAAVGSSSVAIAASGAAAHTTSNGAATIATASGLSGTKVTVTLAMIAALAGALTAYRTTEPSSSGRALRETIAAPERPPVERVESAPPAQRIEAAERARPERAPESAAREPANTAPSQPVEVAVAPALPTAREQPQPVARAEDVPAAAMVAPSATAEPATTVTKSEKVASSRSLRTREKRREAVAAERPATRAPETRPVTAAAEARPAESASTSARYGKATTEAARTSEIELLRRAREALDGRPRESFRLTEVHRNEYPRGLFAQERDALAVEALLRSGDDSQARERAALFVERYPSSPHAHRFRETLGLR